MLFQRKKQSVFKRICRNLRGGKPADAGMNPGRDDAPPGAADGEYFFDKRDRAEIEAAERAIDIAPLRRALSECWDEDREAAARADIRAFFRACPAIRVLESVQSWVLRERDNLPQGDIYALALALITEEPEAETVKFGLSLLELFDTGREQPVREALLKIGRHEEFTLFCLYNIRDWPDGNAHIWQLAKICRGWGRIHAVEALEALTPEIEHWMLCRGWQNTVSPSYSALACAVHGDWPGFLRRPGGTAEELAGMNAILAALLDERRCAGISAFDDPFALLALYMEKVALCLEEAFDPATARLAQNYLLTHEAGADQDSARRRRHAIDLCAALLATEG
jgi:hypothetical protein